MRVLLSYERAVTHARIRITDTLGGAIAMSFGKKIPYRASLAP